MKRFLTTLIVAVGITGPFVAQLAAQAHGAVADVPFSFVVSHRTLPAGQYKVSQLHSGSAVFMLENENGNSSMVQLGNVDQPKSDKGSLTFACYGNQCVLAKVSLPGAVYTYALSKSGIEKNLTHKLGVAAMVSIKIATR